MTSSPDSLVVVSEGRRKTTSPKSRVANQEYTSRGALYNEEIAARLAIERNRKIDKTEQFIKAKQVAAHRNRVAAIYEKRVRDFGRFVDSLYRVAARNFEIAEENLATVKASRKKIITEKEANFTDGVRNTKESLDNVTKAREDAIVAMHIVSDKILSLGRATTHAQVAAVEASIIRHFARIEAVIETVRLQVVDDETNIRIYCSFLYDAQQ